MKGEVLVCGECERKGKFHDITDKQYRWGSEYHHCDKVNGVTHGTWIADTPKAKKEKAKEISLAHWKKRKETVARLIARVAPDRSVLERDRLQEIGAC